MKTILATIDMLVGKCFQQLVKRMSHCACVQIQKLTSSWWIGIKATEGKNRSWSNTTAVPYAIICHH